MLAQIQGQFLENGSYYSKTTEKEVPYCVLLCGAQTVQITGLQVKGKERLDDVVLPVDIRAYESRLVCSYSPV